MKTSSWLKSALIAITAIAFVGCDNTKNQFIIEGKISDADTTMLYLERRSITETTILDSIKLDSDGDFKFKQPNPGYAEFYLLRLGNQAINLAVDSTETIKVLASKPTFASEYTIEGSEGSSKIKDIVLSQQKLSNSIAELRKKLADKQITAEEYYSNVMSAIEEYKDKAKTIIFSDYRSLAAYFALFQKVDGYLIFDPYDKNDLKAFQATATIWDQYKPQSPRTAHLKNFTLAAIAEVRSQASQEATIKKLENAPVNVSENYYDISLPNMNNKDVSLSSLRGKVVILDFTAYQTDYSLNHNTIISKVYNKFSPNVEVYQVSLDKDAHAWQNTAATLPWVCVRDSKSLTSDLITKFNIQGIPTTFLINKKGEIVKRISSIEELTAEIQKIL